MFVDSSGNIIEFAMNAWNKYFAAKVNAKAINSVYNSTLMKTSRAINQSMPKSPYANPSKALNIPYKYSSPIYDQNAPGVADVKMGLEAASMNGCGWIATYNAMHLTGNAQNPESIIHYLENDGGLLMGGGFGTNPESIENYLVDNGMRAYLTYDMSYGVDAATMNVDTFILLYSHENGAHYITVEYRDGMYYAYNTRWSAQNGAPEPITSMDTWLKDEKGIASAIIGVG